MIYPKGIKKGDTIGIVAPSGPFRAATLGEIENALNDLGYNVKFGESCYGFLEIISVFVAYFFLFSCVG